jgi:(1->4)-alpha-D-glucan 1-alpha-D-glucosylmutase
MERVLDNRMIPRATYRLQFQKGFGFSDAARIAPYLARLGLSHVYASPWLKAAPGSTHGYDIVDHHALNPELGTREDFDAMVAEFHANGLGQILDFVPNHMGVGGAANPLWLDVLEWGRDSLSAGWFDIQWEPEKLYLQDKLLVPFLGRQYGEELFDGKLALKFDAQDGSFAVWAYDKHKLPVCPLHYARILDRAHPALERIGDAFANLREWRPQIPTRARELKMQLAEAAIDDSVQTAIDEALARYRGEPGDERSWQALHELIRDQSWRAADFRVAGDDINYRRFFNINELAGLRMELSDVFDQAHSFVFELMAEGAIDGLRIDHIDGLLNPKEYLQRLRSHPHAPSYLVAEKILARYESLREDWPLDGTTGYEFANLVLGLMIDPAGESAISTAYSTFAGERATFAQIVRDSKLSVMRNEMASELEMLARDAANVARQNPLTADFTHNVLRRAIRETVACFPVYRTYVDFEGSPAEEDRRYLTWGIKQARANETEIDPSVFDFVEKLLSGDLVAGGESGFSRHAVLRCAMKVQQYSGPVTAKGLEDTAFYRYNRFIALNEVGGSPERFGVSVATFHKANAERAKFWPNSMLTTSTHDTKRGEDTRARLAVLSEIPEEWASQVGAWSRILRARSGDIEATAPPDRNEEYLFFQMLVGSWPMELCCGLEGLDAALLKSYGDRLKGAICKSLREAKIHSGWVMPKADYEDAVLAFVDRVLETGSDAFFATFLPFVERVARLGVDNSLVQTVLKLTSPGVPDLYQGSEFWDLSMVDPDNRRPVDYEIRLGILEGEPVARQLIDWRNPAAKLKVIQQILALRTTYSQLFSRGTYEPLTVTGSRADRVCAFARHHEDQYMIVLAALFPTRREHDPKWDDTAVAIDLDGQRLRGVLSNHEVTIADRNIKAQSLLHDSPVAILIT